MSVLSDKVLRRIPDVSRTKKKKTVSDRLELMITVVNRKKGEYFLDLIQSFDVNMQLLALGQGTADAEMLQLLGLADSDKAVIFSVIGESNAEKALAVLEEKFRTIRDGKGIAFTVPLSSLIGVSVYGFLSNNRNIPSKQAEKEGGNKDE